MKPPIDLNTTTNRGRHGQRRAHILWVASQIASESGLDGITMTSLARRIGLTTAALYKHFASKQDLLGALALGVVTELARPMLLALRALQRRRMPMTQETTAVQNRRHRPTTRNAL